MSISELEFWFKVASSIIGVGGTVFGWVLKTLWQAHKDLVSADKALTEDVGELKVLVAGQYVKRDEFRELSNAIFKKLDHIADKLDGKADKP